MGENSPIIQFPNLDVLRLNNGLTFGQKFDIIYLPKGNKQKRKEEKIMTLCVIERNYGVANPVYSDRYFGAPCVSWEEASELVYANIGSWERVETSYVQNGTNYAVIDTKTGEVLREYFVRLVYLPPMI